jgi:hypothetical protein
MYVRGYLQGSENGRVFTIGKLPTLKLTRLIQSLYYVTLKLDIARHIRNEGTKFTTKYI